MNKFLVLLSLLVIFLISFSSKIYAQGAEQPSCTVNAIFDTFSCVNNDPSNPLSTSYSCESNLVAVNQTFYGCGMKGQVTGQSCTAHATYCDLKTVVKGSCTVSCSTPSPTPKPACTPDNSCAANTCNTNTCTNNCGQTVNGTKDCNTKYNLNTTVSAGGGISDYIAFDCSPGPKVCNTSITNGNPITLKAFTYSGNGYHFFRWGGDCASAGTGDCTLIMNSDKNVTASFIPDTPTSNNLRIHTRLGGIVKDDLGYTCPENNNCSKIYNTGSIVNLIAQVNSNYTFAGWTGACSGNNVSCNLTMNSDKDVIADFTISTPACTPDNSCAANTCIGSTCQDMCSPPNTFNGTKNCVTQYTLNVQKPNNAIISGDNGIHCGNACNATVNSGTTIHLTAQPSLGYQLTGWTGACTGTNATCDVLVDSNKSVSATFAPIQRNITVEVEDKGDTLGIVNANTGTIQNCTGIGSPECQGIYNQGSVLTLTASLENGQAGRFVSWKSYSGGPCDNSTNPICSFTLPAQDITFSAIYDRCGNNVCNGAPWNETENSCPAAMRDCVKVTTNIYKRESVVNGNDLGTCNTITAPFPFTMNLNGNDCRSIPPVNGQEPSFYCSKNGQATMNSSDTMQFIDIGAQTPNSTPACDINSPNPAHTIQIGNGPNQSNNVIGYYDSNNRVQLENTSIYNFGSVPINTCTGIDGQITGQQGVSKSVITNNVLNSNYALGSVYTIDSYYDYIRAFKQFTRLNNNDRPIRGEVNIFDNGNPTITQRNELDNTIIYLNQVGNTFRLDGNFNSHNGSAPFVLISKGKIIIPASVVDINGIIIADTITLEGSNAPVLTIHGNISAKNGMFKGRITPGVCSNSVVISIDNTVFTQILLSKLGVRFYTDQKNN